MDLHLSARGSSRNSGFLPQSSNMQVIWTVDTELPVGVNVSVNVLALWMTGEMSGAYPTS